MPATGGDAPQPAENTADADARSRPRWIADATVDSYAMLGAFMAYAQDSPHKAEDMNLTVVIHSHSLAGMDRTSMLPGVLTNVPCADEGCRRCQTGQGGYQFRWYHPDWREKYMTLRRDESSWKPPE